MEKYGYIYKITYLDEKSHLYNHFYIGQKKYYLDENLYDITGKNYYHGSSSRAKKEYWPYYSKHKKEIICWASNKEELDKLEIKHILINKQNNLCINVTNGGHNLNDIPKGVETKQKISNSLKGHKVSEETKKKISDSLKGKETWMKGKKHTEESRKKLSDSHKGLKYPNRKKLSEEHRNKLSEAKKGCIPWNKGIKGYKKQNRENKESN